MSVARRERAALVETFRAVGPDAPTLCEGWKTRDLAAHLVVREYRLDASPGIVVPALAGYTARVQQQVTDATNWPELLAKFAAGPPLYSPLKVLDPVANVAELFVHHEDVRRAVPGWEPRALDAETTAAVRRPISVLGRVALKRVPVRLTLRTPDGADVVTAGHGPEVVLTGEPGELLLFAFGRNEFRADFSGDDAAVAAVKAAPRGI
ncbi:MAG TPA: TIGR03085 family metal-binding protein [Mycobacterium sp.]|nr:TIGR03085 family metal-binding protein [Mycobacterium sp.]